MDGVGEALAIRRASGGVDGDDDVALIGPDFEVPACGPRVKKGGLWAAVDNEGERVGGCVGEAFRVDDPAVNGGKISLVPEVRDVLGSVVLEVKSQVMFSGVAR